MRVGVFDSGIGGKSVANAIRHALPALDVVYREDRANVPYGDKAPERLLELVTPILRGMAEDDDCDVLVIACNTVTTTLIGPLRERLDVPIVGVEPMVKPAARATRSGVFAVCATPTTLGSARYRELVRRHAPAMRVLEPDCSRWAYMIENDAVNIERIEAQVVDVCEAGADVIVLGCTHYHWIEEQLKRVAARYGALVLQPEAAIVDRVRHVTAELAAGALLQARAA